MANFPTDPFDDIPDSVDRVGAHRGPKVRGRGWIGFGWAALATVLLVLGGLYYLSRVDAGFQLSLPGAAASTAPALTPTPTPTVTLVTDPTTIKSRGIVITVLNGTAVTGLQTQAAHKLTKLKWTVGTTANASAQDIKQTVVYYSTAANEDVAKGIQLALGVGTIRLSDAFPGAPITVVVGSDFTG